MLLNVRMLELEVYKNVAVVRIRSLQLLKLWSQEIFAVGFILRALYFWAQPMCVEGIKIIRRQLSICHYFVHLFRLVPLIPSLIVDELEYRYGNDRTLTIEMIILHSCLCYWLIRVYLIQTRHQNQESHLKMWYPTLARFKMNKIDQTLLNLFLSSKFIAFAKQ